MRLLLRGCAPAGLCAVAAVALLAACAGAPSATPSGARAASAQTTVRSGYPAPIASDAPTVRVGVGVPQVRRLTQRSGKVLVSETFAGSSTPPYVWFSYDPACLTAGTSKTPKTSIPACGPLAPLDPPGSGALQLTQPMPNTTGLVGWREPLPTNNGLDVQFTLYVFDGSNPAADGSLLFFTDAKKPVPDKPAGTGGCLGYFSNPNDCYGRGTKRELPGAYLGVGFDERGEYSNFLPGGPGFVPETVALGGARSTGYHYLGGVTDKSGQPASLPFDLNSKSSTRPTNAPTVDVALSSSGLLEVSIDIHDGQGFVTYLSEKIVGVQGQPALPPNVYVGFIGSCGLNDDRHQ